MATPLKLERLRRGLSVGQMAMELGVAQPTINRIENGRKKPSPELAVRLANYFNQRVTRDQILFPEYYPETPKRKAGRRAAELQEAV